MPESRSRRRFTTSSDETRQGRWLRLESDEHAADVEATAARTSAPRECSDRRNGGVVQDHLGKLFLLDAHGGEADVLRGTGGSAKAARVLLREESLWDNFEEIDIQGDCSEDHAKNQRL